jgi:hypothetical protein
MYPETSVTTPPQLWCNNPRTKLTSWLTLDEVGPFLRTLQSLSWSGIFPSFIQAGTSSPCSQEPITGPYFEPVTSGQYPHTLLIQDLF